MLVVAFILFFSGYAINRFFSPWGTWIICSFHAVMFAFSTFVWLMSKRLKRLAKKPLIHE